MLVFKGCMQQEKSEIAKSKSSRQPWITPKKRQWPQTLVSPRSVLKQSTKNLWGTPSRLTLTMRSAQLLINSHDMVLEHETLPQKNTLNLEHFPSSTDRLLGHCWANVLQNWIIRNDFRDTRIFRLKHSKNPGCFGIILPVQWKCAFFALFSPWHLHRESSPRLAVMYAKIHQTSKMH